MRHLRSKSFLHDPSSMNQSYLLILNLYQRSNLANPPNTLVDTLILKWTMKSIRKNLKFSLSDMLFRIDALPVLPKNKILLYQRYILSKFSWHLTVATLSKTWVIQHLDNIASRFVRQWLSLPISATLSGISLSYNQFGRNLQLPSVKFLQCQTVLRSCLRSSNDAITSL